MPQSRFLARSLAMPLLCLLLLVGLAGFATGCAAMPRMLGGSGDVELRLDGEQVHETDLPVGNTMTLDMRDPGSSGYVFAGTVFDPALLRLDGIEPFDGGKRLRYKFTTLAQGECDVLIKIRKQEPGYRPDTYKRIKVTITN